MKKISIILMMVLTVVLCGCGKPKSFGNTLDYSAMDTEDFHVIYVYGMDNCYSDGSWAANMMFNDWMKNYEKRHN